jgi:signal transduction histidine kinase/ActR/RegA family two-component response regulator
VGLANHTALIARDGRERPIEDSAAPILDDDGNILGVVLVFHDVSERRRLERERARGEREREQLLDSERAARADAERAARMKDEFVATVSHELRTPLNAILGWTQVLQRRAPDTDTLSRGLGVIERNTRLQAQLISDLLDVSRIVSGKLKLELQLVDLPAVVDAALESVRLSAQAKNIQLDREVDERIAPVAGDPSRLEQVVSNLLTNAIKFTPVGGRVVVKLEHGGSHSSISVTDTGVGIAADFLPHMFDRFRQADSSTTRRHGGLGLGLTIVKQLVELHGGSVSARSAGEGQGASFIVRLPAGISRSPAAGTADVAGLDRPGALTGSPAMPARRVKVLVVEDEPDTRELLERLLSEAGCQVIAVDSAAAAYDILASEQPGERPDILISDIGLPDEDGYSLIRRVRARPRSEGGSIPAIALTAFARPEDRRRALHAGFQVHLAKPVEPAELVAMVASFAGMVQ